MNIDNSLEIDLAAFLREVELDAEGYLQECEAETDTRTAKGSAILHSLGKIHALMGLAKWHEAEALAMALIVETIEANAQLVLAGSYLAMASICRKLGMGYREKPYLDQALEAAKSAQSHDYIAITLCSKAEYHQRNGGSRKALDCLSMAATQISKSSSLRALYVVFRESGYVFKSLKLHHKALDSLVKALELGVKLNDIQEQMSCLNSLGSIYSMLSDFVAAKRIMQEGIDLSIKHKVPIRRLNFMFSLGAMQLKQGDYHTALQVFLDCRAVAEEIGFRDNLFVIELFSNLAGCYGFLGNNEEALQALDKAINAALDYSDQNCLHELSINRAKILADMGKYSQAESLLKKAISFARKDKNFGILKVALSNLSLSFEMKKDYKNAIKTLRDLNRAYQDHLNFVMLQQGKKHEEEINAVIDELHKVREHCQHNISGFSDLHETYIGFGNVHKDILNMAIKAAQHPNAGVLITGETGTGKDVLANLIHQSSVRKDALFLPVNMAAISENLMESLFFGHRKGAFTGANQDHKGFFMEANKGTLYLDEISEMPPYLQAKLLRVLETGKVTPVGCGKEVSIDTRIICSSNRDLDQMVQNGSFRRDLFYRLDTITIHLPPLRERLQDLEILVSYFVQKYCRDMNKSLPKIENTFFSVLRSYSFPGNIRELRNIIEHLVIMHEGDVWSAESLGNLKLKGRKKHKTLQDKDRSQVDESEKTVIIEALRECGGKQKDAATRLGISEPTLTRRIRKYGLSIYTKKSYRAQK